MKNLLIISWYFPPNTEIGGLRPAGIAKYLPLYGWNPIVLTPVLPGDPDPRLRIIQTPSIDVIERWKRRAGLDPKKSLNEQFQMTRERDRLSLLDRLVSIPCEIITYPDDKKGWYAYAVQAGEKIITTEKIDAIFSSSPPITCNLIAKTLSERFNIPWIADFRDLWSQNHYTSHSWVRNYFDRNLEIKTLKQVSAITTVSQPLADKLISLHGNANVFTIRNGFDPGLINTGHEVNTLLTIVHTGNLYQGKRDPAQLFAVLNELFDSKSLRREDFSVDFFGYPKAGFYEDWLQREIAKNQLEDCVHLHGEIPHAAAIAVQRKAQILLLLTWDNPEESGVYTGKLFEYLAARRPILSLGYRDGGVVKELLCETRAGVHVANSQELMEAILQAYREYKESGAVLYHGIDAEIMKYTHKEMARNFAEVFESII